MMDMKSTTTSLDEASQRAELGWATIPDDESKDYCVHRVKDKSPRHTFLPLVVLSAVIIFAFDGIRHKSPSDHQLRQELDAGQRRLGEDYLPPLVGDGIWSLQSDFGDSPAAAPALSEELGLSPVIDEEELTSLIPEDGAIISDFDLESPTSTNEDVKVKAAVSAADILLMKERIAEVTHKLEQNRALQSYIIRQS